MKPIFLILIASFSLFADVSYSQATGFDGALSIVPYSTAVGIAIGVITTVIVFKMVRNLLCSAKRY